MEKAKELIDLKIQINELEAQYKSLQKEVEADYVGSVIHNGYALSKKSRTTYKLKEGVDKTLITQEYPEAIEIKIDAKELYKVATNPDELVDEVTTEYLEVRVSKKDDAVDLDI